MSDRAIQTAVQKLAGTFKADICKMYTGSIVSVDENASTCSVRVLLGNEDVIITNVLLQAAICDGLQVIPSIDSDVLIIGSTYNPYFVACFSDIDKLYLQVGDSSLTLYDKKQSGEQIVILNDGSYGGLVKVADLVTRLNKVEDALKQHILSFNTHVHASNGLPPATLDNQVVTNTQRSDIENKEVTHGKV